VRETLSHGAFGGKNEGVKKKAEKGLEWKTLERRES